LQVKSGYSTGVVKRRVARLDGNRYLMHVGEE